MAKREGSIKYEVVSGLTSRSYKKSKVSEAGRVCEHKKCITKLSIYNQNIFCALHTPFEIQRDRVERSH